MKLDKILTYSFAVSLVLNAGAVSFLGYSRLFHPEVKSQAAPEETQEPLQFGVFHLPAPAPTPPPVRDPRRSPMKLSEAIARGTFVGKGDDDDDDDRQPASRSGTPSGDARSAPGKSRSGAPESVNNTGGDAPKAAGGSRGTGNSGSDGTAGTGSSRIGEPARSTEETSGRRADGQLGAAPLSGGARTASGVKSMGDRNSPKNVPGGVSEVSKRDRRGATAAAKGTGSRGRGNPGSPDEGSKKETADSGNAAADKTADGKAAAGVFVMPKMAKMWSVPPGQKIVLPEGLKLVMPKELPVLTSVAPLSREQLAQLRKLLQGQNLQQMKGLTKEQLKKMLAARKDAEQVAVPPDSAASAPAATSPKKNRTGETRRTKTPAYHPASAAGTGRIAADRASVAVPLSTLEHGLA
jgi:hypothetical protein